MFPTVRHAVQITFTLESCRSNLPDGMESISDASDLKIQENIVVGLGIG